MFRAVLNKKIFPQSSSPKATTAKICLYNKQYCMTDSDDEMFEEANNGSKWVKTDSECKFLISIMCKSIFHSIHSYKELNELFQES